MYEVASLRARVAKCRTSVERALARVDASGAGGRIGDVVRVAL